MDDKNFSLRYQTVDSNYDIVTKCVVPDKLRPNIITRCSMKPSPYASPFPLWLGLRQIHSAAPTLHRPGSTSDHRCLLYHPGLRIIQDPRSGYPPKNSKALPIGPILLDIQPRFSYIRLILGQALIIELEGTLTLGCTISPTTSPGSLMRGSWFWYLPPNAAQSRP